MNTKLFGELIKYVADKEDSSYVEIWGKKLISRLRGKGDTFARISTDESVNTKIDYKFIKSKVAEYESIDDLLLMCSRGVVKYDETSGFLKSSRILILMASLILINLFTVLGSLEISGIRDSAKKDVISKCKAIDAVDDCKKNIKEESNESIQAVIDTAKWKAIVFTIFLSILSLLVIGIISNDRKGRMHLEVLSLYLERLKLECEEKSVGAFG